MGRRWFGGGESGERGIVASGTFCGKEIYAKAQSRKGAKRKEMEMTENEIAKIVVDTIVIDFDVEFIRDGIRIVNGLSEDQP